MGARRGSAADRQEQPQQGQSDGIFGPRRPFIALRHSRPHGEKGFFSEPPRSPSAFKRVFPSPEGFFRLLQNFSLSEIRYFPPKQTFKLAHVLLAVYKSCLTVSLTRKLLWRGARCESLI